MSVSQRHWKRPAPEAGQETGAEFALRFPLRATTPAKPRSLAGRARGPSEADGRRLTAQRASRSNPLDHLTAARCAPSAPVILGVLSTLNSVQKNTLHSSGLQCNFAAVGAQTAALAAAQHSLVCVSHICGANYCMALVWFGRKLHCVWCNDGAQKCIEVAAAQHQCTFVRSGQLAGGLVSKFAMDLRTAYFFGWQNTVSGARELCAA